MANPRQQGLKLSPMVDCGLVVLCLNGESKTTRIETRVHFDVQPTRSILNGESKTTRIETSTTKPTLAWGMSLMANPRQQGLKPFRDDLAGDFTPP